MRTRANPWKAWGTVLVGIHVTPWSSLEHSLPGMCRHPVTAKHVGGQISELLFCLFLSVPMDPCSQPKPVPRFTWDLRHHQKPWISMNRIKPELLSPR